MTGTRLIGLLLILITTAFSYKGFRDQLFFDKYKFEVGRIRNYREYWRLITGGFLHVSRLHLILNMVSLFLFTYFPGSLPWPDLLVVYLTSLVGGHLLAWLIRRRHDDYSSVGASGAIYGIIFAAIALFPHMRLLLFWFLPLPGWLYGLLYVGYSLYGVRKGQDRIGHEAHLGGALLGMFAAIALEPDTFANNYLAVLLITAPVIVFIYLLVVMPQTMKAGKQYDSSQSTYFDIDDLYNEARASRQQELDRLLDKIGKSGIDSLSKKERERLDELSR